MSNPNNFITTNNKDFNDFLGANLEKAPANLDQNILNFVHRELNPSYKMIFAKLLGIQAFIGLITMTFCPQFHMSLTNNHELFHYFHHTYGENICMAICGSIFMGSGAIFASYLLSNVEVKKIRETAFLYYLSITSIALATFMLLGAEFYFKLASFWFVGATMAGTIIFELNVRLRQVRGTF